MANEKIVLCEISGPIQSFGTAIEDLVLGHPFTPKNAISFIEDINLLPLHLGNDGEELLKTLETVANELAINLIYRHVDTSEMSITYTEKYLRDLLDNLNAIHSQMKNLSNTLSGNNKAIQVLSNLEGIDVDIETLFSMRSVKFRFGRIPSVAYLSSRAQMHARKELFYTHTSDSDGYAYIMYFALPSAEERVDAFFTALGFERIWISSKSHGSPAAAISDIEAENKKLENEIAALNEQKRVMRQQEEINLINHYSFIKLVEKTCSYIPYAGESNGMFYMVGLVPLSGADFYKTAKPSCGNTKCKIINPDNTSIPDNESTDTKIIKLVDTERRAKELYSDALNIEHRLTDDIAECRKDLTEKKYKHADEILAEHERKAIADADGKVSELNINLQTTLDKLTAKYYEGKEKWVDTIFKTVING